jgi:hypothetical protein
MDRDISLSRKMHFVYCMRGRTHGIGKEGSKLRRLLNCHRLVELGGSDSSEEIGYKTEGGEG